MDISGSRGSSLRPSVEEANRKIAIIERWLHLGGTPGYINGDKDLCVLTRGNAIVNIDEWDRSFINKIMNVYFNFKDWCTGQKSYVIRRLDNSELKPLLVAFRDKLKAVQQPASARSGAAGSVVPSPSFSRVIHSPTESPGSSPSHGSGRSSARRERRLFGSSPSPRLEPDNNAGAAAALEGNEQKNKRIFKKIIGGVGPSILEQYRELLDNTTRSIDFSLDHNQFTDQYILGIIKNERKRRKQELAAVFRRELDCFIKVGRDQTAMDQFVWYKALQTQFEELNKQFPDANTLAPLIIKIGARLKEQLGQCRSTMGKIQAQLLGIKSCVENQMKIQNAGASNDIYRIPVEEESYDRELSNLKKCWEDHLAYCRDLLLRLNQVLLQLSLPDAAGVPAGLDSGSAEPASPALRPESRRIIDNHFAAPSLEEIANLRQEAKKQNETAIRKLEAARKYRRQ